MICQKCGKEIDNDAKHCFYCGVEIKRKKPVYKKWWFWLLMALATIFTVAALGSSGSDTTSPAANNSQITQSSENIVYEEVDLRTMLDDLDENALKAEKTYQNKYVEVVGVIRNFDSDGSYISIEPVNANAWDFTSVMCYIENDTQLNFLLTKAVGDKVTIKGKISSVGEILGYSISIAEVS